MDVIAEVMKRALADCTSRYRNFRLWQIANPVIEQPMQLHGGLWPPGGFCFFCFQDSVPELLDLP
jgi:hypothetical protein